MQNTFRKTKIEHQQEHFVMMSKDIFDMVAHLVQVWLCIMIIAQWHRITKEPCG